MNSAVLSRNLWNINVYFQCITNPREFPSPKSQFVKYQCFFSMYYHYANSAVLSRNSQNVNVCVLSMYYHVLLMYFPQEKGRKPYSGVSLLSDAWPSAENSLKFQRIKQNLLDSPTNPVNYAKFAPFIHPHLVHYFQISDHWQRTPGNWSESTRFRAVRPQLPWITRNSLNLHPWPAN